MLNCFRLWLPVLLCLFCSIYAFAGTLCTPDTQNDGQCRFVAEGGDDGNGFHYFTVSGAQTFTISCSGGSGGSGSDGTLGGSSTAVTLLFTFIDPSITSIDFFARISTAGQNGADLDPQYIYPGTGGAGGQFGYARGGNGGQAASDSSINAGGSGGSTFLKVDGFLAINMVIGGGGGAGSSSSSPGTPSGSSSGQGGAAGSFVAPIGPQATRVSVPGMNGYGPQGGKGGFGQFGFVLRRHCVPG